MTSDISLFEKNMLFFKQYSNPVYQSLTKEKILQDVIKYLPDQGNYSIRQGEICVFLQSQYDRKREIEYLLDSVQPTDTTIVLFGFGDGMVLDVIYQRFPQLEHLIIIDPHPEPFLVFLHHYDFVEYFSRFRKVSLILNQSVNDAKHFLEELISQANLAEKRIAVLPLISYRTIYREYYKGLVQTTLQIIRFSRVNIATKEAFRSAWLVNELRNLKHVSPEIGALKDAFYGLSAIIVSAGPSLKKNIHLLHKAKKRALVIAVGSAMTILNSHGIVPHFRVAVDGGRPNETLFAHVDTEACPLIYSNSLFYKIVPYYKGEKWHMPMDSDLLTNYVYNQIDLNVHPVRSGFSVANIAFDLFIQLGCSRIVVIGQDLCYTRGKLHAEGAWSEAIEEKYIRQEIETVDIFGNRVYTDKQFLGMKKIFENLCTIYPGIEFINATEGGLHIEGMINKPLAELLEMDLSTEIEIDEKVKQVLQVELSGLPEKQAKLEAVIHDIQTCVNQCIQYNEKIIAILHSTYRLLESGVQQRKVLAKYKKATSLVHKQYKNEIFRRLIQSRFADLFEQREVAYAGETAEWRESFGGKIRMRLQNSYDVQEYMLLMRDLISEYKGEQELNILFE